MDTRRSGFWLLVATEGVMTAGYAISFPFLAIYLSVHRGLPMVWVGAFLAVSMLVASAAQFIGGEVSDAIGRRQVMVVSLALRSVLIAVIAWTHWSFFYLGIIGTATTVTVGFVASLFTARPTASHLEGLVFGSLPENARESGL